MAGRKSWTAHRIAALAKNSPPFSYNPDEPNSKAITGAVRKALKLGLICEVDHPSSNRRYFKAIEDDVKEP